MLSRGAEYALRAVVHLASIAPACDTAEKIAAATGVPPAYLAKLLRGLVRARVLRSRRGLGGGVSLAPLPEELTILAVVNAVEPVQRIRVCPLSLARHRLELCGLHRRMDGALALFESELARTTIAEMLVRSQQPCSAAEVPALRTEGA